MYRFLKAIFNPLLRLMFRIEFVGQQNIPAQGGFIMVSNHRSGFDPLFLAIGAPRQVFFMAKAELMKIPVVGWVMKKAGCFGVERGSGDTSVVDIAANHLQEGDVVGIFPEGTRAPVGKTLRPKSGVAHIAKISGVGVLPCCVSIDGKCRLGCRVKVVYGRPISYQQLGLEGEGSTGLRTATRTMWNQGVLPLLEAAEGPAQLPAGKEA